MPVQQSAVDAVGQHQPGQLVSGEYIPGTKNVLLERGDVHLAALSDAIILPVAKPFTRAVSAGDIFVFIGLVTTAVELVVRKRASATRLTLQSPRTAAPDSV